MSLCAGSRVNTNFKRCASWSGCYKPGTPESYRHPSPPTSTCGQLIKCNFIMLRDPEARVASWLWWGQNTLISWRWHILSIPLNAGRGISAEHVGWMMCFLLTTLVLACVLHELYIIHTIHYSSIHGNQNKPFLKDTHSKSWCGHLHVLDDLILLLFLVWFQVYILS